jgi:hypothetical protein
MNMEDRTFKIEHPIKKMIQNAVGGGDKDRETLGGVGKAYIGECTGNLMIEISSGRN